MNADPSDLKSKTVPCMDTCALYWKGCCSINVLAQKATYDFEQKKKEKELEK
jgi:hypothetical protein